MIFAIVKIKESGAKNEMIFCKNFFLERQSSATLEIINCKNQRELCENERCFSFRNKTGVMCICFLKKWLK